MPKLGISEHEIVRISKKGDFRNFLDQFWDFIQKRAPKINNQMKLDVETILSNWN